MTKSKRFKNDVPVKAFQSKLIGIQQRLSQVNDEINRLTNGDPAVLRKELENEQQLKQYKQLYKRLRKTARKSQRESEYRVESVVDTAKMEEIQLEIERLQQELFPQNSWKSLGAYAAERNQLLTQIGSLEIKIKSIEEKETFCKVVNFKPLDEPLEAGEIREGEEDGTPNDNAIPILTVINDVNKVYDESKLLMTSHIKGNDVSEDGISEYSDSEVKVG